MNRMFETPELLELAGKYVDWEVLKSDLEDRRPELLAVVFEFQEKALDGQPDAAGLNAAREALVDLDEKIQAADNRLGRIHDEIISTARESIESQCRNLAELEDEVVEIQSTGAAELGKALAILEFFQGGPEKLFATPLINYNLSGSGGARVTAQAKAAAQAETKRLLKEYPRIGDFQIIRNRLQFLKNTWAKPVPQMIPRNPSEMDAAMMIKPLPGNEHVREAHLKNFFKGAVAAARKEAGVEAPKPKNPLHGYTLYGQPII